MKRNFIYIVKVGGKLRGGGANGVFRVYEIKQEGYVEEVGSFKRNIITLPPNYIGVVQEWLKKQGYDDVGNTQMILEY